MPHIPCGAEVYADSGLSPAGVAWKMTRLITENDFAYKFYPAWKAKTDSKWGALTEGERMTAMQKFHGETGVCIYDKARNQIIP